MEADPRQNPGTCSLAMTLCEALTLLACEPPLQRLLSMSLMSQSLKYPVSTKRQLTNDVGSHVDSTSRVPRENKLKQGDTPHT